MATRPNLSWDDLRVVLAVLRHRSHGGAGRALGVDPTTVGRRVAALEKALGARLFDRTPSGLAPTETGSGLLARCERIEEEVLAAERELHGADARLSGPVRITAGDGFTHYVLVPALAELRRAHPSIAVELRADTRALDLSRREADVAVRLIRPREPALVARRLGSAPFGFFASRGYLERRGTPRTAEDLAHHELVDFDESHGDLPQVKWLHGLIDSPRWSVRATTTTAQVLACAEGQGIALLPSYVTPRESRLVSVLPSVRPPPREAWIVVHQDVGKSAKVAAIVRWLKGLAGTLAGR